MLRELTLRLGADSEGRRIGGEALREITFDLLELAKQFVVFGVRNCRTVEDIVLVRSARQAIAQLRRALTLRWLLIGAGTLGWFLPLLL